MGEEQHPPTNPRPNRFTTLQRRVSPHTPDSTDSKPQEAFVSPAWPSTSHNASHDTSTSLQLAAPGSNGLGRTASRAACLSAGAPLVFTPAASRLAYGLWPLEEPREYPPAHARFHKWT